MLASILTSFFSQDTADALVVSYEATSSDASQVDFTIETAQQLSGYPYLCSSESPWRGVDERHATSTARYGIQY
jgi:hypothetical protein